MEATKNPLLQAAEAEVQRFYEWRRENGIILGVLYKHNVMCEIAEWQATIDALWNDYHMDKKLGAIGAA